MLLPLDGGQLGETRQLPRDSLRPGGKLQNGGLGVGLWPRGGHKEKHAHGQRQQRHRAVRQGTASGPRLRPRVCASIWISIFHGLAPPVKRKGPINFRRRDYKSGWTDYGIVCWPARGPPAVALAEAG